MRVRKCRGYSLDRNFVRILSKITKKFGPNGGCSDPISPPCLLRGQYLIRPRCTIKYRLCQCLFVQCTRKEECQQNIFAKIFMSTFLEMNLTYFYIYSWSLLETLRASNTFIQIVDIRKYLAVLFSMIINQLVSVGIA